MKKEITILFGISLAIFLTAIISGQGPSFCCEKTIDLDATTPAYEGGYCINALESQCDSSGSLRKVPTSCEGTSYCKKGTCVNKDEGICMENTPRKVCEELLLDEDGNKIGIWYDKAPEDVSACQMGCCLIGEQAAFVTQTRCQKLSSIYSLNINFRADIDNEISCIASARPEAKGACVFETTAGRTCRFIKKAECTSMKTENPSAEFHENFLCTNPSLGADCGMTERTTCVEGKDEVYFVDSCGNLGNVYNAGAVNDINYWTTIQDANCRAEDGSLNAVTCGECDYYLGSTCKPYTFGIDPQRAQYGDNVCRNLDCSYDTDKNGEKETYKHGETWCGRVSGENMVLGTNAGASGGTPEAPAVFSTLTKNANFPGSRDFRFVCYNGEVSIEPCADFRQEICSEGVISEFKTSVCRINRWRDCYTQNNKQDCENYDKRDCIWVKGMSLLSGANKTELVENSEGQLVEPEDEKDERKGAACIPKYTPGFDFWKEGTDAKTICGQASVRCTAIVEKGGVFGVSKRVVTEEETILGLGKRARVVCVDENGEIVADWKTGKMNLCSALGDCGVSVNYIGEDGFYGEEDIMKILGEEEE